MTDLPNIGLIGKMGSGKTTAAKLLIEHFGYSRLAFADKLREHAEALWGIEKGWERGRLQKLGQAVRDIDYDTWVRLLIKDLDVKPLPVVVDDLRYKNEAWALKGEGFILVRIVAENHKRLTRLEANGKLSKDEWKRAQQLNHVSETQLDDWPQDYRIVNIDGKAELLDELARTIALERRS